MANPDKPITPVVRFAPSPTGYLHVGGARTALFNFLFARHHGGTFILRIEDTDQKRFQPEALAEIYTSLKWLGLQWDEGPDAGGGRGPYFQSQRTAIYRRHAERLLAEDKAYCCFCSEARLASMREEQEKAKMAHGSGYDRRCRHLSETEIKTLLAANTPYVVRLKVPDDRTVVFNDLIRGDIAYHSSLLDDLVLLKSDGFPTYHLANVVDDHLMQITHVLRGDEWIASTPKHILIYEAFGWQPPLFAHMPVILAQDGGKLSKRRGAASVLDYQRNGFLPEALFNFLVLLGWNPGDEREIMNRNELIKYFDLNRISPKAAVFDEKKLEWMNSEYIKMEDRFDEILDLTKSEWKLAGYTSNENMYYKEVLKLYIPRIKTIKEIVGQSGYFFKDPELFEPEKEKLYVNEKYKELLILLRIELDKLNIDNFTHIEIEAIVKKIAEEKGIKIGEIIHPTRLAVSGVSKGPGLYEMMEVLGKNRAIGRIKAYIERISKLIST